MTSPTDDPALRRRGEWRTIGTWVALVALYVLGAVHWVQFFNNGILSFTAYDWPKERLYLQVFRDAYRDKTVPLHVAVPDHYVEHFPQVANFRGVAAESQTLSRFLAIPETIMSPQALLLPVLENGDFIVLHFLVLYTVGFVGCLWCRRRFQLSLVPYTVLFLVFTFNGYITSHLGAGHIMCGGYFLLPFFGGIVLDWMENKRAVDPGMKLALVYFGMLLQGSLHVVVWCWIFVALIVAWNPTAWRAGLLSMVLGVLLAGFRLAPAAVAYWNFPGLPFAGGYPTLETLLEALLVIRDPTYLPPGHIFWWEYDLYVGLLGLALLAYFGVYLRFVRTPEVIPYRYPSLDVPLIVMVFLSLGHIYYPVLRLPLPLVNSERVTSRFIVVPFVMLLLLAAVRMQQTLSAMNLGLKGKILVVVGLVVLWRMLWAHASRWEIGTLEQQSTSRWHVPDTARIVSESDGLYLASLYGGVAISLIGLAVWIYLQLRSHRSAVP